MKKLTDDERHDLIGRTIRNFKQGRQWLQDMLDAGIGFHWDEDPYAIVYFGGEKAGQRFFCSIEAQFVSANLNKCRKIAGDETIFWEEMAPDTGLTPTLASVPVPAPKLFYLQLKGNHGFMIWWRAGDHGYGTCIKEARAWTKEELDREVSSTDDSKKYRVWPKDLIDEAAARIGSGAICELESAPA